MLIAYYSFSMSKTTHNPRDFKQSVRVGVFEGTVREFADLAQI